MVKEMYKEATAVVRAETETSEQFGLGVGLGGSALSPLVFIMVMNLIIGKVSEQEELYADDLTVVADNKEDFQKTLSYALFTLEAFGMF